MTKSLPPDPDAPVHQTTLLVVDDDEATRDALHKVLEDAGYRVETASDGEAALHVLATGTRPSMIVLDLVMPKMDGWAFVSRLKDHDQHRRIPVLVMTAHGSKVLSTAPVSAAYMAKPIRIGELLTTIEHCLRTASTRLARESGGPYS